MSRGFSTIRPCAVWLGVTVVAAAAGWSVPGSWRAAGSSAAPDRVADLLVAGCATALAASLGWLWLVTAVTVAEVVAGAAPRDSGATRRLVLLACGAAVVASTAVPAQASGGDGADVLVGLALPERAVGPSVTPRRTATGPRAYVVRVGDSLWSIARTHPAPGTDVDARWRAIWRRNRTVVGADPDLIHPGQSLRLPRASTSVDAPTHTEKDGDRR